MDQDIKRAKAEEEQESLEEEVKDVKAGIIEIDTNDKPEETEDVAEKEAAPVKAEIKPADKPAETKPADKPAGKFSRSKGKMAGKKGRFGKGGRRGRPDQEFDQKIVDLARVTRVMAGGKRMRFRCCVVIGDRKGRVAIGLAKGKDVTIAISKAVAKAKKEIVTVPFVKETIPFQVEQKFKAAKVLLRPAQVGKGVIAGGAVRVVLELAGIPNIVAKILGTNNKVTNVKATIKALSHFEKFVEEKGVKKDKVAKAKKTDDKTKVINKKK